jgi:hypothetical protein
MMQVSALSMFSSLLWATLLISSLFFCVLKIDFQEKRPDHRIKEKISPDMKQVMKGEHHIHGYTGHVHASQVNIYNILYMMSIDMYTHICMHAYIHTCTYILHVSMLDLNCLSIMVVGFSFSICMGDLMARLQEICMRSLQYLRLQNLIWSLVTIARSSIRLESFLYHDSWSTWGTHWFFFR